MSISLELKQKILGIQAGYQIINFLDHADLIPLIKQNMFSKNELEAIYNKLEYLHTKDDEWTKWYYSFNLDIMFGNSKKLFLEEQGDLFHPLYPFKIFLILDLVKHKNILEYVKLNELGLLVSRPINIKDEDDILRKDMLDLRKSI